MTANELLIYGSLGCSVVFYVLAALMYTVRRPPIPPSLPATSDTGPQTPAVANLLANGGRLTPEAVPATLLDLAARKVVQIDETEPHVYECRVESSPNGDLTPYERRVHELLRGKAVGGVVPAAALSTGTAGWAKSWLRSFEADVVAEARRLGLTEPRWPRQVLTLLGLFTSGALLLVIIAGNESEDKTLLWFVTVAVAFATVGISSKLFTDSAQLVTHEGLPVQARWLALRKYLHDDELFSTLPPTAVAVRDRYMAYGAALGVAAAAVRAIPMGAESDRRAWSSVGGHWRQVRVSYPRMWPPAYGASPRETLWRGVRIAGISALVLFGFYKLMPSLTFAHSSEQSLRDGSAIAVLLAAVALVALASGLWLVLAGIVSLFGSRTVTGDAIRLRQYGGDPVTCYLAVDDGTSEHVRAWKVRPILYDKLIEYQSVTVTLTPLLSYVRTAQRAPRVATARPEAVQA